MNHEERSACGEEECAAAFAKLFPPEYWTATAIGELAPLGWEESPLRFAFHPTLQQVYDETVRFHRNLASLRKVQEPARPEPTLADVQANFHETPIDAEREIREILARSLWDIFSDNHEVLTPQGKVLDIGSFRGAGGFIADYLNGIVAEARYDYMDFYLGTLWLAGRVDLTPVYALIFRRLKEQGFDWVYHFPRLAVVDMRPWRDALADASKPEWLDYSPDEAFAKEQEDAKRDAEIAEMRESLDKDYRAAVEEARHAPPPPTVLAYCSVYSRNPRGWPPEADDLD
jgi:hypothetical protein